jgi:hypothetical protein
MLIAVSVQNNFVFGEAIPRNEASVIYYSQAQLESSPIDGTLLDSDFPVHDLFARAGIEIKPSISSVSQGLGTGSALTSICLESSAFHSIDQVFVQRCKIFG